jgi:hypothetical protein
MWAQFDQLTIIDDVLVRRLEGLNTKLQVLVPMTESLYISSMLCQILCVFPIWIKSTLSTWDATEPIGISMVSTWTMYNRHIIGAEEGSIYQ